MGQLTGRQLGISTITPEEYLQVTGATYSQLANTIGYPYDTVKRWFQRGKGRRKPPQIVCRVLALELELAELKNGSQDRHTTA